MGYILYGSQTSPFVRRIRIAMENIPFEFKELNIFEAEDAKILKLINPINQVPVLVDGETKIWDSRQIFHYLNIMYNLQNMEWDDENLLTAIEGAMTAGVNLLLMKRSGIDTEQNVMFINRQKERIGSVLDFMKPQLQNELFQNWTFHSNSLYCFLDWAAFRGLIKLDSHPEYKTFMDTHSVRPIVQLTQIPQGK